MSTYRLVCWPDLNLTLRTEQKDFVLQIIVTFEKDTVALQISVDD